MRAAAIALTLAAAAARAEAAPCSEPALLTVPDTTIFDGGGVVAEVGTALPSWHLQDGGGVGFAPLAPGLVLFGPIRQSGWAMVRDQTNAPVIRVQYAVADKRAIGVAPPVLAAVARGQVQLGTPPPAGALALVLYGLTPRGQVAESWAHVDPTAPPTALDLHAAASCPGVIDANAGDRVAGAWVDAAGRTSVLSTPVTVTAWR